MKVLLVEPKYYTKFPPLGLLKLASYHRSRGNKVKLVRGIKEEIKFNPDRIEITSLFTYAWKPVHEAIKFYHTKFPRAKMRVGGIYASLMPNRLRTIFPFIEVYIGLYEESDDYLPAYDLLNEVEKWEEWNSTILFTTRGCIRNCSYCVVPKLEGKLRTVIEDLERHIYPSHRQVILWDNNFFASPDWKKLLKGLQNTGLRIDFNQGIDARLIDDEKACMIAELKASLIRTAFDNIQEKKAVIHAVNLLKQSGLKGRKIFIYALYNFHGEGELDDTPATFFERVKQIAELGCVSYPMRYEPLESLTKNRFVSPLWTEAQLDIIVKARRILGYGGAFPPYEGLVKKFEKAASFEEAFSVYPLKKKTPKKHNMIKNNENQVTENNSPMVLKCAT